MALQARAGRMILGCPKLTPSKQVLDRLKWRPLSDRWDCHRANMMYKVVHENVPQYMITKFNSLRNIYSNSGRQTRGSLRGNFEPPKSENEWGRRRFCSHGVFIWNNLPNDLKEPQVTESSFKKKLNSTMYKDNFKFYQLKK